MDWNNINWEWLGLVAVLGILVGGFAGGVVYVTTRILEARRDKRWSKELNDKPAVTEQYDWALVNGELKRFPRQRSIDES